MAKQARRKAELEELRRENAELKDEVQKLKSAGNKNKLSKN